MCGPCNSGNMGKIGYLDVLDEKSARHAKLPTSTLVIIYKKISSNGCPKFLVLIHFLI